MSRFITRALRRIVYFQVVRYNAYVRVCVTVVIGIGRKKPLRSVSTRGHEGHKLFRVVDIHFVERQPQHVNTVREHSGRILYCVQSFRNVDRNRGLSR